MYDSAGQVVETKETVRVENSSKAETGYKMVGYYAGWASYSGYNVSDIDASKLTHINYAFANISDDRKIAVGDTATDYENFKQLQMLKEKHPHVKTLISVGGWTWSRNFSDVALTEAARETFAESVRQFILKYGFDGVDLDWEYPVSGGHPDNKNRPGDKRNYTLLIKKIRETLDNQSEIDGKEYLLTIAAGASKGHAANMELAELQRYVNYIQLMTYDIHGEWDAVTGLNAPLYQNADSSWSVRDGVETYINSGVPSEKLVMGLPFYGRAFHEVDNLNNGLNQSFSGGTSLTFAKIDTEFVDRNGFLRHWKEDAEVPILYNGSTFISYDDEESIGKKTDYIKFAELGGAMMWELSQDPGEVLLNKIYIDLNQE
ncbi:glycoside hydrolase family 18 [Bacillus sp. LL01]|nr:glycoside hydrolase family 18 [Bacillus sp. LL01]